MPNLSIKNVPPAVVKKLHQRAKRNHRSLQGELMVIVHEAAQGRIERPPVADYDRVRSGTKTVEEIAAEIRARRKHPDRPNAEGPSSVDIIRAARDAR
jgi:antitoxin FitA